MLSRRHVLRSTIAIGMGAFGGCLSQLGWTIEGHLQFKVILVDWNFQGQTYRDQLLWIWYRKDSHQIDGRYDPTYVGEALQSPTDFVVDDALHEKLTSEFTRVQYVLGVCGSKDSAGCINDHTSRADFNRVQLHDGCTVLELDSGLNVLGVQSDTYPVETVEIREIDFDELHSEDGR